MLTPCHSLHDMFQQVWHTYHTWPFEYLQLLQVLAQPLAYNNLDSRKIRVTKLRLKSQVSENAYVNWDVGPNHTVTYTKPADATEAWVMWRRC